MIGQSHSVVSLPLIGQSDTHSSLGLSESLVLPRDNSFGSSLSLNSRGSTNHSSPELTFSGVERSSSLVSLSPQVRVTSPQTGTTGHHDDRSTSPLSPVPPGRPRSRSSARRRQDQVKQRSEEVRQVLQGCYHGDWPPAYSGQVRLYLSSMGTGK